MFLLCRAIHSNLRDLMEFNRLVIENRSYVYVTDSFAPFAETSVVWKFRNY